jgi:hypothetical protein
LADPRCVPPGIPPTRRRRRGKARSRRVRNEQTPCLRMVGRYVARSCRYSGAGRQFAIIAWCPVLVPVATVRWAEHCLARILAGRGAGSHDRHAWQVSRASVSRALSRCPDLLGPGGRHTPCALSDNCDRNSNPEPARCLAPRPLNLRSRCNCARIPAPERLPAPETAQHAFARRRRHAAVCA